MDTVAQDPVQWAARAIVLVRDLERVGITQRDQAVSAVVDITRLVVVVGGLGEDVVT